MERFKFSYRLFFIHLAISVAILALPTAVLYLVVAVATVYFCFKKNVFDLLVLGIYSILMKGETTFFVFSSIILALQIVFFLSGKYVITTTRPIRKTYKYFVGYLFFLYFFQLFVFGNILSFPLFAITFLSPMAIMFYLWRVGQGDFNKARFLETAMHLAIAQATIAIFQAISIGVFKILNRPTLGDFVRGTASNSNYLTFVMFAAILPYLVGYFRVKKRDLTAVFFGFFFLIVFILNDSKTYLFAFALAILIYQVFFSGSLGSSGKRRFKRAYLILCSTIIFLLGIGKVTDFMHETSDKYYEYIFGKFNAKYEYYARTLSTKTRSGFEYVMGTGPGTNGSRAGNALAYDVLYKKSNTFSLPSFIPPFSNRFTRKYISNLYTWEYAEASSSRSALLGNPFNSFCANYVEFGIVGFVLFLVFYYSLIKNLNRRDSVIAKAAIILLISNFLIAFLDPTFERPAQVFPTYLLCGIAFLRD